MLRYLVALTLSAILCLFSGCSTNPVTGKTQLSMPLSQQIAIGAKQYEPAQQQQGGRYIVDPELNLYVNAVGQRVAAHSDLELPYEFVVLDNGTPNAWALPGGKMAINRGLLTELEDEAQLAAVLGHEIVHAAAQHSANQMMKAQLLNVGVMAAGVASRDSDYAQAIGVGSIFAAQAVNAHYGRQQELESDKYGIEYMVAAGYDPQAAVELQQKFVELSKGRQSDWLSNLFASHPPSEERVARNREMAAKYNGGERNRVAYQRAISQLKKDAPAYEAHEEALAAAKEKDYGLALNRVNRAIDVQPKAALFHITKGQILNQQQDYDSALSSFNNAARLKPDYFMGHLGAGLVARKLGRNEQAKTALMRSMAQLETTLAAFHLGELSLAEGDRQAAAQYFQYAAQDKGELGSAARERLSELQGQP